MAPDHKVLLYIQHHTALYIPSSELGLPQPLSRKRVFPPHPDQRVGGHTRRRLRGWGSPNSDDWRKSLALCLFCAPDRPHHFHAGPDPFFSVKMLKFLLGWETPDSDFYLKGDPDADPDPTFNPDADPDPDPSFQINAQKAWNPWKCAKIGSCSVHFSLTAGDWCGSDLVPDPAHHFNADSDPDFYLMRIRMRIQVTKIMGIHNTGWIRIHRRESLYSGRLPYSLTGLCFSSTLPCPDGVECQSRSKQHYLQFR
jgi:hypothetical protein